MKQQYISTCLQNLHKRYSGQRNTTKNSQLCELWSIRSPPDILEDTPTYDDFVEYFDYNFTEDEMAELYDMTIEQAVLYLVELLSDEE